MSQSSFVSRSVHAIVDGLTRAIEAEELAKVDGLLQRLDPRVKALGLTALIVAAAVSHKISVILSLFGLAVLLAVLSRVPLGVLARRVWIAVLLFTSAIAAPALFVTPGRVVCRFPIGGWPVTEQGLRSAAYLVTRTETAATLAVLMVLCTPWAQFLKALRSFRLPVALVAILGMTHRYIFLLLETARDMFESRRSRTVGTLNGAQRRAMTTRTAGVLMSKSLQLSNDVYLAMQSRGFTGEVHVFSQSKFRAADYVALCLLLTITAAALWAGR
jgi:cobalt/nickel transport system permease protein